MITRSRDARRAQDVRRHRSVPVRPVCSTCGWEPTDKSDQVRLLEDLGTVWWSVDPDPAGGILRSRHCLRCQPHQAQHVACRWCGDGPILTGALVSAEVDVLLPAVTAELEAAGWRPARDGAGWVCCS